MNSDLNNFLSMLTNFQHAPLYDQMLRSQQILMCEMIFVANKNSDEKKKEEIVYW